MSAREERTETARAEAMAAFFAWPAAPMPGSGSRPAVRLGPAVQLRAALVALTLALTLGVGSMLAPLAAAAGHGWGAGGHFLLLCHLSL